MGEGGRRGAVCLSGCVLINQPYNQLQNMNKNHAHIVRERCIINEIFNFSHLFCSLNAKLWFLILHSSER